MEHSRGDVTAYSGDNPRYKRRKIGARIQNFLATNTLIKFFRVFLRKILDSIDYSILMSNNGSVFYNDEKKTARVRRIREVMKETLMLLRLCEAYSLVVLVEKAAKIAGDVAELGTYKGGSAKLICEAKSGKQFHVFDTFEGLPGLSKVDDHGQFEAGKFVSSYDEVNNLLSGYDNVRLYKGLFPSTAAPLSERRFSFVHLDADIYESTYEGLRFFYSRMNDGGMILSHDYTTSPGVRRAFDEFFTDKPEHVIELAGSQCLVIKSSMA